jgi:pimeloyl-ACP methyl ester carboxylesterase
LPAHFLHGNGFCAGTYTPFLKYLQHNLHIIASDVRGHGDSVNSSPEPIRHWRVFAEDVRHTIEKVCASPVIGMGHSLGAVSTYIAAAAYPGLFRTLVLIDPVIFPRRVLWTMAAARWLGLRGRFPLARSARQRRDTFKDKHSALERFAAGHGIFKTWSKDFIEAYLECGLLVKDHETALLRCDPELEAQIFESVPADVWSYAPRIRCPVLVLRGQHSDTIAEKTALRLEQINPNFSTHTIPGTGHFLTMEKPQDCARQILDYIGRTTACEGSSEPG